jgi:hypothetical protein
MLDKKREAIQEWKYHKDVSLLNLKNVYTPLQGWLWSLDHEPGLS